MDDPVNAIDPLGLEPYYCLWNQCDENGILQGAYNPMRGVEDIMKIPDPFVGLFQANYQQDQVRKDLERQKKDCENRGFANCDEYTKAHEDYGYGEAYLDVLISNEPEDVVKEKDGKICEKRAWDQNPFKIPRWRIND